MCTLPVILLQIKTLETRAFILKTYHCPFNSFILPNISFVFWQKSSLFIYECLFGPTKLLITINICSKICRHHIVKTFNICPLAYLYIAKIIVAPSNLSYCLYVIHFGLSSFTASLPFRHKRLTQYNNILSLCSITL